MVARAEPTLCSDERTTLTEFLDYQRATLLIKIDGLTDEQARAPTVPPSDLNLLGLLRHMAEVEQYWFRHIFAGQDVVDIYCTETDYDGDHHPGPDDTVAQARSTWQDQVDQAKIIVAGSELADLTQKAKNPRTLRWILVHLIEEYARHCGHADLLRERIDGAKGE